MKKIKKEIIVVFIYIIILFSLSIADMVKKDRFFSESENRILAEKPAFDWKEVLEGNYSKDYEEYVSDQFFFRDNFILLKTYADIGLRKKEINDVYFVFPDTLYEKHDSKILKEPAEEKLQKLSAFVNWCKGKYPVSIMLIPTADAVYKEQLPKYAPCFEQDEYLNKVKTSVGKENFVDVREILNAHKKEYIYYRTDHHWTTLGAFYGYQAWAEQAAGITGTISEEDYTREAVTDDFLGTLHGKVNIPIKPDTMELFIPKTEQKVSMYYDFKPEKITDFYEKKHLNKKDKYRMFFDGNHAFMEIRTGQEDKKNLLVIKDSYANCFLPFLTEHYANIYVVDFRYYRGTAEEILKEYKADEILVLYNVVQFVESNSSVIKSW